MGLKYFPEIDEPHMQRTQKKSRFAYLFDLDEEPSGKPKQHSSKSANNKSSAIPGSSDKSGQKPSKARSIIQWTVDFAKKGLEKLKATRSDEHADQDSDQEFVKLRGSGGPWTSTELMQAQSKRVSHEYSPPGGGLRRSNARQFSPSAAYLKRRRASLNQRKKLARREREYQYMSRQTIVTVWT